MLLILSSEAMTQIHACPLINNYLDVFVILLAFGLFFLVPCFLSLKGIELLANRYLLFGTWTAPQPVNGPILPQPAPAG